MNFTINDTTALWQAVSRVLNATRRHQTGTEVNAICIEAPEPSSSREPAYLYIHRYSGDAYASHRFADEVAEVLEGGKVILSDAKLMQALTASDSVSVELVGNDLVFTDTANSRNVTKLRTSTTDPFLYTRITSEVETVAINTSLSKCLWLYESENDMIAIDGSDIASTNKINYCLIDNGSKLTEDECIFLPVEFFSAIGEGSRLGINNEFGHRKVWIIEPDFRYYTTPIEPHSPTGERINWPSGYFRKGIMDKLQPDNAKLTVNKDDLSKLLSVVLAMSSDKTYRHGYCSLELTAEGELIIDSLNAQIGDSRRILMPLQSSGVFKIINYPRMMLDAIGAIETGVDEIVLEVWPAPNGGYGLLIHSECTFNFIPCARGEM